MDHSEIKHLPKVDHTPAELDTPSRILLDAAAKIERDGWCQRDYGRVNGPTCIHGAVLFTGASKYRLKHHEGISEAIARLGASLGGGALVSMVWNDDPKRTKSEVIAKLRAVALGL